MPAYRDYAKNKPRSKKNAPKQITIFSDVKPELDPKKFADIILRLAREQVERER